MHSTPTLRTVTSTLAALVLAASTGSAQRAFEDLGINHQQPPEEPWLERIETTGARSGGYWRIAKGGEGESVAFDTSADSVVLRSRLRMKDAADGFAPLLSWDDIWVGAGRYDGAWYLYRMDEEGTAWVPVDFGIRGESIEQWLAIDIVRPRGAGGDAWMLFVNGVPVSGLETRPPSKGSTPAARSVAALHRSAHADTEVAELSVADGYPQYVIRALRAQGMLESAVASILGLEAEQLDLIDHRYEIVSDAERRRHGPLPKVHLPLAAGDLSFEEAVWYQTRTVNRSYYDYAYGFEMERAWAWVDRLVLRGADYLPLLEGRDWKAPWSYNDWNDYYIQKISGYITPEVSGDYRLWICGDEEGALFLSDSTDPAGLQLVARFTKPTGQYVWDAHPGQRSQDIYLEAGVPRYFELWHLERTGDDYVAVAWSVPEAPDTLTSESSPLPTFLSDEAVISVEEPTTEETGNEEAIQLIPSRVLSSWSSKPPGTWPRRHNPDDASFLHDPADIPAPAAGYIQFNDLLYGKLRGDRPIYEEDYSETFDDEPGNLYHAVEGGGLEWLWCKGVYGPPYFPNLYAYSMPGWLWYYEDTVNPQQFVLTASHLGYWIEYYATFPPHYEWFLANLSGNGCG